MKNYVVGFMFDYHKRNVVLIRKNKPEWQSGLLNGIGGKIETDETPQQAMIREYKEEAGVGYFNWDNFLTIEYRDCIVYFFRGASTNAYDLSDTTEKEVVEKIPVNKLPNDTIENLRWIIPLALDNNIKKIYASTNTIPVR